MAVTLLLLMEHPKVGGEESPIEGTLADRLR
jgi:hypothetical protein